MTVRYFRLTEDMQAGTWDLGDLQDEHGQEVGDPYVFAAGRPIATKGRLSVPIDEPGRRLDFCTAGLGVAPVLHVRVATLFAELARDDVQLVPVAIKGHLDMYQVLVATKLIRCIDDHASAEVRYWKPEHGQPERVGDYKSVIGMRIDTSKLGDTKVFRTQGWTVALIVSEDIKLALERERTTGAKFTEV
ncbi:hypothetical protein HUW62_18420 [Myxococcus sp. AM011]|uniref:imm11 family protein n=1 Tax=Myxococcus sp. AM011 TaxID=2745200 RepID=UPI001595E432|nr:DUF1629 domain-containing protein [Myxococcus sp. AM011]NVJ23200.1 hypothetical protein [Myxococcus sp. AM011]